nr:unnamed protein product [Digitaria exilis]
MSYTRQHKSFRLAKIKFISRWEQKNLKSATTRFFYRGECKSCRLAPIKYIPRGEQKSFRLATVRLQVCKPQVIEKEVQKLMANNEQVHLQRVLENIQVVRAQRLVRHRVPTKTSPSDDTNREALFRNPKETGKQRQEYFCLGRGSRKLFGSIKETAKQRQGCRLGRGSRRPPELASILWQWQSGQPRKSSP